MSSIRLQVNNLSFSHDRICILDSVSFAINSGEVVSILGPNEVGKTTLFNCILGIYKNYFGKIYIDNIDTSQLSSHKLSKLVAYIPQSHYPAFNFKVIDIVLMGVTSQLSSISSPTQKHFDKCILALEKVGALHLINSGFNNISQGERQLVMTARALVQESKILILDEPVANLDFANQILILKLMTNLSKDGYTIIQSSHNPNLSYSYSDKIIAIRDKKILAYGTPQETINDENMCLLYDVPIKVHSLDNDRSRICMPI